MLGGTLHRLCVCMAVLRHIHSMILLPLLAGACRAEAAGGPSGAAEQHPAGAPHGWVGGWLLLLALANVGRVWAGWGLVPEAEGLHLQSAWTAATSPRTPSSLCAASSPQPLCPHLPVAECVGCGDSPEDPSIYCCPQSCSSPHATSTFCLHCRVRGVRRLPRGPRHLSVRPPVLRPVRVQQPHAGGARRGWCVAVVSTLILEICNA